MHGIQIASFVVGKDGQPHPYFRCDCDWESNPAHKTWEAAGREFDAHLKLRILPADIVDTENT
jgi:hypothetical protein